MLFATRFKTPTLVVHSQLDYRLDVSEGYQLFTTLQRLGVPSEMLYFSRRRPLGAEAAEFAALVQDGERMVRPLDAAGRGCCKVTRWDSINQAIDRRSRANR